MMLFLLYFNIFWCSLAVLCVSVKCTTGISSRDKHLQEELNEFEISIQRLLSHNGSSKTSSQQTRVVDTSSGSKNLDIQFQRDRKFEERLTGTRRAIPASIDMAYQPQKQNPNGNRKIVLEQDDKSEETQEKKKTPLGREHASLDASGDEDHESEEEKNYSTDGKIENNPVKYGKNNSEKDFEETSSGNEEHESEEGLKKYSTEEKIENNPVKYGKNNSKNNSEKDFEETSGDEDHESEEELKEYSTEEKIENNPVKYGKNNSKNNSEKDLMHESRRKNSKTVNEVVIPNAIDLAFNPNGPQNTIPTRTTTAKPTTLYWPPMTLSNPTANQICRSAIDLGFLVEASKSVARTGTGNYRRLINFIKHVVLRFSIGPTATRIGVISYANRPISLIGFNDGENILDVLKFLNLPCHHCLNAQTGLALSFAHSFLYGCSCSLRPRVLVVVTDGRSSDGVHIPSRILKQKGVKIIAVGVGRYFNIHQLNVMASRPVQDNVFTGDFSKIHHVTNELVRQICKVTDGSMAVPSSSSPCSCP